MKKIIVSTSINNPTEAIKKFDEISGWNLIVVGDHKTPKNYKLKNGLYLAPSDQEKISIELSDAIGWNCMQRRNLGMLYAFNSGADIICTVDDDNIPLDNWGEEIYVGKKTSIKEYQTMDVAFDPMGVTEYSKLWHRGFPLELISSRNYSKFYSREISPDIQADFWNGDPDIDAFCRLEHRPACNFNPNVFPFSSNKFSPFNSQNTFITKNVAADYFLFPFIGRMDDIWASYYVQSKGHRVIYNKPTVYQDRNEHNLINDLELEFLGYKNNLNLIQDLYKNPNAILNFLPKQSIKAWNIYRKLIKNRDT
jgi:hypothetical protein